ncbi:MAG: sugar transferase [Oscillospiraceae bacterium]|nr:sugar transferase [Oscillospiraceae bacterium]
MVKQLAQKMQRTCLVGFKALLMAVLFAIFFGLFGFTEHELWRASRTAAISMSTFIIVGICLIKIYGGFPIGIKKTKEIIYSSFIAIGITDVITYFQISIMLINYEQRATLTQDFFTMVGVVILQLVTIVLFGYLGNYLYFQVNPPANVIVVYGGKEGLAPFVSKIGKYKKQYRITDIVSLEDENLKQFIRDSDRVFLYSVEGEAKKTLVEYCYKHSKVTYITPELSDIVTRHSRHVILDDVTVLESRVSGLTFEQELTKRILDVIVSGIGVLIAGPIMLIEAALIKLEDGGPVFFRQPRLTKDGKVFEVLKFRTMIVDADKEKKGLVKEGDSRITRIGNILRKTRLDELPQFLNILKGDMSIVGPRPEQVEITERYVEVLPEFKYRLKVKAGLTGLAQIRGKYNTTPKDKLILDLIYIEQYSIWIDLKLMLQTVKVLFKSDSTEGVQGDLPIDLSEHPALQEEKTDSEG